MGVEPADCLKIGELLGKKVVANEIVAFKQLADWLGPDSTIHISERSRIIATYCAVRVFQFGHDRHRNWRHRADGPGARAGASRFGLRAMIAGMLASCMTACIAGALL